AHVPGLAGLTVTAPVTALGVAEIVLAMLLLSLAFTAVFLAAGCLLDSPAAPSGLINLLNLPILFTSNAMFPRRLMPGWLQAISDYNPVSLAVNVLRENLFGEALYPHPPSVYLLGLLAYSVGLSALAFVLARRGLQAQ